MVSGCQGFTDSQHSLKVVEFMASAFKSHTAVMTRAQMKDPCFRVPVFEHMSADDFDKLVSKSMVHCLRASLGNSTRRTLGMHVSYLFVVLRVWLLSRKLVLFV